MENDWQDDLERIDKIRYIVDTPLVGFPDPEDASKYIDELKEIMGRCLYQCRKRLEALEDALEISKKERRSDLEYFMSIKSQFKHISGRFAALEGELLEQEFNDSILKFAILREKRADEIERNGGEYGLKKRLVSEINVDLKSNNMAILHRMDGMPQACFIYAVASKDGKGRYTLESRKTKKRSGFYKSLAELIPVELVRIDRWE